MSDQVFMAKDDVPVAIKCSYTNLIDPRDLVDHPDNNNAHTDEQVEWGVRVVKASGWRLPIIVSSRKGFIVSGHLRKRIALALGLQMVPVDIQPFESRAEEVKHLTADNELARISEFDEDKFAATLKSLSEEMDEIAFKDFIEDANEFALPELPSFEFNEDEGDDPAADEVPEVKNPVSKKGDLWILGPHRLLCGDSSDKGNIEKVMDGFDADMVFTDPPYRMGMGGGGNDPVGKAIQGVRKDIEHLCSFDPINFLNSLPTVFGKGVMNAYVFCNKDLVPDYLNWAIKTGYSFNILFWKKPNAIPMGGSHRPDVEYLLLFRKGAIWHNSIPGVNYSKCLEYKRELSKDHPTMKPVDLIVDEVKISSNEGGVVVEFFSGSGSTMIACEKAGRRCFGMELDETYTDVAVQRWQNYTGEQAKLESTGQTYEEVTVERQGVKS